MISLLLLPRSKKPRRHHDRRTGPFKATWRPSPENETRVPVIVLDISCTGMSVVMPQPVPKTTEELHFDIEIEGKHVPIIADNHPFRWQKVVDRQLRYGFAFKAIRKDDYYALERFCAGGEMVDRRKDDSAEIAHRRALSEAELDALLPTELRRDAIELLIRAGRLDRPKEGSVALMRYFAGAGGSNDGSQRVVIQTKRASDPSESYMSTIVIKKGRVKLQ